MTNQPNKIKQYYFGEFTVDERYMALYERLTQYYKDTPDSMDNRTARPYWEEFKKWCNENGYTLEEVNECKRNINI